MEFILGVACRARANVRTRLGYDPFDTQDPMIVSEDEEFDGVTMRTRKLVRFAKPVEPCEQGRVLPKLAKGSVGVQMGCSKPTLQSVGDENKTNNKQKPPAEPSVSEANKTKRKPTPPTEPPPRYIVEHHMSVSASASAHTSYVVERKPEQPAEPPPVVLFACKDEPYTAYGV